jgi:hypothetical protein
LDDFGLDRRHRVRFADQPGRDRYSPMQEVVVPGFAVPVEIGEGVRPFVQVAKMTRRISEFLRGMQVEAPHGWFFLVQARPGAAECGIDAPAFTANAWEQ